MAFIQSLSTSRCSMIPLLQVRQRRFAIAAIKIETSTVHRRKPSPLASAANGRPALLLTVAAAAAAVALSMMAANAIEFGTAETLSNIPQTLSGECNSGEKQDCNKKPRIQRPKSRKAESCTIKCVTTCIRGGDGSPGEGPLNVRKPLVVFKQGFRSRQYCLTECSDICNLIRDGDDGP